MPPVEDIPIRFHPRVLSALGSQLVTNNVIAVLELVKNSYDAMATQVDVRLSVPAANNSLGTIEIEDNGTGMTRRIIEDVWCVVATPYRSRHPVSSEGKARRRVSGEKGLGRLSAARLGDRLEMTTRPARGPSWRVEVRWSEFARASSVDRCTVRVRRAQPSEGLPNRGTLIRILGLAAPWTAEQQGDLREQLSRLVSPFTKAENFRIRLSLPTLEQPEPLEITPPEFLSRPPYCINGRVDKWGKLTGSYIHVRETGSVRTHPFLERLASAAGEEGGPPAGRALTHCGPFEFEIRGWDIDSESVEQIARRFEIGKSVVRLFIRNFRGISVYRDGILALPKTDASRDWLALDLRRVSRVGERMSTSQLVGYVSIGADGNPAIVDTSDREGIEENEASRQFKLLVRDIVALMEKERAKDRTQSKNEPVFNDLFAELSAAPLVGRAREATNRGAQAEELLPTIEEYEQQVQRTIDRIQKRLFYYSRLASLGVLSGILVHEVRNQAIGIGLLSETLHGLVAQGVITDERLKKHLNMADDSIRSLERLAERFAPLASRATRTRRKDAVVEEVIRECVDMREREIQRAHVEIEYPASKATLAAVDPGELLAILLNLLDNALYWMSRSRTEAPKVRFAIEHRPRDVRFTLEVDDNGPGVRDGDEERIFWPGVTRKPDGLGMGLTVAAELVSQYGGRMSLMKPGQLGGATFRFDLPITRSAR
jgi:signal transduction histidine kinase